MKKNSSMHGTLNKLFGKKSANNNSLYANNPPWILPQGSKKASADYADDVHNSFAFLDDSGTATLKSRPGPRVRPVLNFSNSNTDAQGLAVPTPSVPMGFTDNAYMGNGSKMNGNYRMYSSVGDLRLNNYYDDDSEEIPAPPSMPPPPPPTMAPQQSPPSSTISSPSSPSPPDFIPPTPNSSAPMPPILLPTDQSAVPTAEPFQTNVAKWKSETGLNAGSKDFTMTLPNRFSLNPAAFQHNQGQINFDAEPRSTLPKAFKIPPPAPTRTSSIQMQEPQNIDYPKDPSQSAVRSSFNPSVQAKLFASNQGQKPLNDTINKRKSMLIMEDLQDFPENPDQRVEKSANITDSIGSRAAYTLKDNTNVLHNHHVELNKQIENEDAINANKIENTSIVKEQHHQQPYKLNNTISEFKSVVPEKAEVEHRSSQNGTERNTLTLNNRPGYTKEMHSTLKPSVKCVSLKPIIDDLSLSNSNGSKHESLRKEIGIPPQEFTRIDKEAKIKPERSLENIKDSPPTPPPMIPPPPPPKIVPSNPQSITPFPQPVQNITPPKTLPIINSTAPPPTSLVTAPVVRIPSPLLSPKPKTFSVTPKSSFVPPPPPPKAPPAPPPLPSSVGPSSSVPLLEALQAKQQTLRKVPKSVEVRPAQTNSVSIADDDQKFRVDKIKGELEALFSPKKDDKGDRLKNSRLGLEANRNSNGNFSHSKGGENNLVNSLMLKVPILPAKTEMEDVDTDSSEWLPKSNKMEIQIPEPDYVPSISIRSAEKPLYLEAQSKIPKPTLESLVPSTPVVPAQKNTMSKEELTSSIPTYKPHHGRKVATETSTLNELPVVMSKPEMDDRINLGSVPQHTEIVTLGPSVKQEPPSYQAESTTKHPVTGEQVEGTSPMALLMAAQKRAQKAKSLDRGNLPKISVTNGLIMTSSLSPYNERKANTFSVPNKESFGQVTDEEVTSFTSNSDCFSVPSTWRDEEIQLSNISSTLGNNFGAPSVYNSSDVIASTTNWHVNDLKPKSTTFDNHIFTTVPTESPTYNISPFPSPILDRKIDNEMEYGIIPPPAEFMNSPIASSRNSLSLQQEGPSYSFDHDTSSQSNFNLNYDRNSSAIQPFTSLSSTSNHGFNSYSSDNYSTALNTDTQRGSLIKRRLYMPEPESSRRYGQNTNYLRSSTMPMSMSYSNMHGQSSSNMVPDPRRSSTSSRFLPQGRRDYESMSRMVPPMPDLKYMSQNSDYSAGKSSTRAQSKYPQGMTFTVRPGTRQPISQMYQGGYL